MMHQALDDSDQTRKYGISESIIQAIIMTLLQLCRNVSWIRDAILSRLVTIIKCLVHHAVYCISLSCLLSFLCNPYIPSLIYEIFYLLVFIRKSCIKEIEDYSYFALRLAIVTLRFDFRTTEIPFIYLALS